MRAHGVVPADVKEVDATPAADVQVLDASLADDNEEHQGEPRRLKMNLKRVSQDF